MKFGFYVSTEGPAAHPDSMVRIAQEGERLGFDSLVLGDHIVFPNDIESAYPYTVSGEWSGGEGGEHLEQLTALTFLAAVTDRIRLVSSVMIVPYRNPLLAAKMLATLDVLSKGRLTLGIGVGWMEEEFVALDTPPFAERGAVTDEYLRAYKELWTSDNPSFEGKFCSFSNIRFLPKPVQKPHPPIWVGGQSRRAMRRAAILGDAWHPVGAIPAATLEPDQLAEDMVRLGGYAESTGRDPSEIQVVLKAPRYDSSSAPAGPRRRFTGEPDQILQDIESYAAAGVSQLIFDPRNSDLSRTLERMSWLSEEVMSRAR